MKFNLRNPEIIGYQNGNPVYAVAGGTPATKPDDTKTKPGEVAMGVFKEELQKALKDHEDQLAKTFQKYEDDLAKYGSVTETTKADLQKMSEDYASMQKDVDSILQAKTKFMDQKSSLITPGQEVVDSDDFRKLKENGGGRVTRNFDQPIFLKNTITGEAGSPAEPSSVIVPRHEVPGIVPGAFRMLQLLDVWPMGVTGSNLIHYSRELLFTNAAAETLEGATKPESTLTFEDATSPVRTIAHWLKVSKQVLDDAPALQTYIDQRLRYGVRVKLEQQIIAGDGTNPNMSGIIGHTTNHTALTVVTADTDFDAANRAKYEVVNADYMPDAFLINPADWGRIERKKDGNNRYLGSDGVIGYLANGLVPTLWGLPVILSNSVTAGSFACLSWAAVMLWLRQMATVTIHDQDEDNVQKNLLTIRGELRAAHTTFRPASIVVGSWPEA